MASDSVTVHGVCPHTYEAVARAFSENFAAGDEIGASFSVFIDGECVIDIHGGMANVRTQEPWAPDTLATVFSSGKAVMAYLVARAVSKGMLDYAAPIARYWPEFAANGKGDITLAQVLSHQAGLCGFPDPMPPAEWLDWDALCARLAAMAPMWPPGTAHGYHPQTVGFIIGEVMRRATGRTIGAQLREDFFARADLDIHCGIGPPVTNRVALMRKPPKAPDLGPMNPYKEAAFLKPWSAPAKVAPEAWMAAELPASNMHATARGLAGIMQPVACGGEGDDATGLDPYVLTDMLKIRVQGPDLVVPFALEWASGLMKNNADRAFGPSPDVFGHAGFGGSCIVIDPARRLTAAYVMNAMSPHLVGDPRAVRLLGALYDAL